MKSRLAVVGLGLLAGSGLVAAESATDLSWLAALPGLSSGVQKLEGGETKIVYTLTADADATLERVREGLSERGWTVRKRAGLSVLGVQTASTEGLRATKGAALVKVLVLGAPGSSTLVVKLTGGTTPPPKAGSVSAAAVGPRASGSAGSRPAVAGPRVVLEENAESRTVECADNEIVVNGNRCRLTLVGACRSVVLNGNENDVVAEGSVGAVHANGNRNEVTLQGRVEAVHGLGNGNTVLWSEAGNPTPPRVSNLGRGNRIEPSAR